MIDIGLFTNQAANWAVFTLMMKTKAVGVFLATDCANDGIVGMRTNRLASMF